MHGRSPVSTVWESVSMWGSAPHRVLWASLLEKQPVLLHFSEVSFSWNLFSLLSQNVSPKLFQPGQHFKLVPSVPSSFPGKSLVSKLSPFVSNKRQLSTATVTASLLLKLSPLCSHQSDSLRTISLPLKKGLENTMTLERTHTVNF